MPLPVDNNLLSITKASSLLKVSPDTLRRLEKKRQIVPKRGPNGERLYSADDITLLKQIIRKPVGERSYSIQEAANILKTSPQSLRRWEREGKINPNRTPGGQRIFTLKDIQILQNTSKVYPKPVPQPQPVSPPAPLSPTQAPSDPKPLPIPQTALPSYETAFPMPTPPPVSRAQSNEPVEIQEIIKPRIKKKTNVSKYVPYIAVLLLLLLLWGAVANIDRILLIFPRASIGTITPSPAPGTATEPEQGTIKAMSLFRKGSIIFQGIDSANFSEDNSNFYWDDVKDFLGVGTNIPDSRVTIAGKTDGDYLLSIKSEDDSGILDATNDGLVVTNIDDEGNLSIAGEISDVNDSTLNVDQNLATGGDISIGGGDITSSKALNVYSSTSLTAGSLTTPTTIYGSTISFDDSHLTSAVKLTNYATSLPNGNIGIIDAISDAWNKANSITTPTDEWSSGTNVVYPNNATDNLAIGGGNSSAPFYVTASTGDTKVGDLTVSGGNIILTGVDCTTYTNGGTLTTDASGNVVCANDDGGGGTLAFTDITSGTNITAAMLVGTGASLGYTGSGTIDASTLIGATWAAPGTIGSGTPNSGAFTTLSSSGNLDVNGVTNDIAGTLNLSGDTLTSSGDLTIDATGGGVKIGTWTPSTIDLAGDDLYVTGDLEVGGTIYGNVSGSFTGSIPWDELDYPNGSLSLPMSATGQNTTTFSWGATGALNPWTFNLTNSGASATTQNFVTINNALTNASTTDVNTENLLLIQQLDTSTGNSKLVDNAIKIDSAGNAGITDAIEITNSAGNITNGIYLVDTGGGTFATGINFSGTFTNFIDTPSSVFKVDGSGHLSAGNATMSGVLTVGNGTTNQIRSPYGPLALQYKSGGDVWTDSIVIKDSTGDIDFAGGYAGGSGCTIYNASGTLTCTSISGTVAGSVSFANITSGTNTTAAMIVDTGGSLTYANGGTINASSLIGGTWAAPGAIGSGTPNTGTFTTLTSDNLLVNQYATVSASLALGLSIASPGPGNLDMSGALTVGGIISGSSYASIVNQLNLTGSWGQVQTTDANADLTIQTAAGTGKIIFSPNATEAMRITDLGKVGIGTSTPSEKLDVAGSATVSGTLTVGNGTTNLIRSPYGPLALQYKSGDDAWTDSIVIRDSTGDIDFAGGYAGGSGCTITNSSGTLSCISITGAISGTIPWSELDAPTGNLTLNMGTNITEFNWDTGTSTNNLFSLTTDASSDGTGYLLNLATGTSSAVKPLHVSAGAVESLAVDASGNVGVGTTSPTAKLDVSGTASVSAITVRGTSPGYINQINGNDLIFRTSVGGDTGLTDRMTLTNAGNLGIGTTDPVSPLDVYSAYTSVVFGSSLISPADDSTFVTNTGNWSGTNWTVGSGVATHTAGSNTFTLSTLAATSGRTYKVSYTVNTTSTGTIHPRFGGTNGYNTGQSIGTESGFALITTTTTDGLSFVPNGTWAGYIDNVYVYEVTPAPSVITIENSGGFPGVEFRAGGSTATDNVFIGVEAGMYLQDGFYQNTAIGYKTLSLGLGGSQETALGAYALRNDALGFQNTAIGVSAMESNANGAENVALGYDALFSNISGDQNVALGTYSLLSNNTGNNNTGVGYNSGRSSSSGSGNLFLGYQAGDALTSGSTNIIIGYNIDLPTTSSSNMLDIGNLIYATGIDGTGTTLSTGNVGIGTTNPTAKLDVAGVTTIDSSGNVSGMGSLQIGAATNSVAYSRFGTATTSHAGTITTANDLLISGDLELNGNFYLDNNTISNSAGTAMVTLSSDITTIESQLAGSWLVDNQLNVGMAALMVNQASTVNDIFTASAGGIPKFTITNAGDVGIGTTAPANNLHIVNTNTLWGLTLEASGGTTTGIKLLTAQTDIAARNWGITEGFDNYGEFAIRESTAKGGDPLTAGTTRLVILSGGNVGIGTTSPPTPLTVVGGGANSTGGITVQNVTTDATTKDGRLKVGHYTNSEEPVTMIIGAINATVGNMNIGGGSASENAMTEIRFFTAANNTTLTGTRAMTINSAGNVGIGTTAPLSLLSVGGVGRAGVGVYGTSATTYGVEGYAPASIGVYGHGSFGTWGESTGAGYGAYGMNPSTGVGVYAHNSSTGYALYCNATAANKCGGNQAWFNASDRNLKENITPINNALSKVLNLQGVTFNFKSDPKKTPQMGFIAQDVLPYAPEVVAYDESNGYWGMSSGQLTALLVNAIQEQQVQISSLSEQIGSVTLTDVGNLDVTQDVTGSYQLTDTTTSSIIDRVGTFGHLIVANITAGAITAKEGFIEGGFEVADTIIAGAVESQSLVTDTLTTFQGTVDNLLISSGLVAGNIQTKLISPVADSTDVTVRIGSEATPSGKLAIQDSTGTEVASIDSEGNASFSGTLFADEIKSKSLDDINALLSQVKTDQELMMEATDWNTLTSTDSANLSSLVTADLYVTNQGAFNSLSVSNSLTVGSDLVFLSTMDSNQLTINSIDTLSSPLRIQSLAMAPVEIMAGLVTIDTQGNMMVTGNLAVKGDVSARSLAITPDILNGPIVASIDATGSAVFSDIQTTKITGSAEARGSVDILPAEDIKLVEQTWAATPAAVLVSPSYNTQAWVEDTSLEGFTIRVSTSPETGIQKLYWWAIW